MEELNLFFDTETSDLINFKARNSDPSQPWIVQLAAVLCHGSRQLMSMNMVCTSEGLPMSKEAQDTHGISPEVADSIGFPPPITFGTFIHMAGRADNIIAHNITFDWRMLKIMARRLNDSAVEAMEELSTKNQICTMRSTTKYCQLPYPSGRSGYKWPKLEELYPHLFGEEFSDAHDAMVDVQATIRCYFELKKRGVL